MLTTSYKALTVLVVTTLVWLTAVIAFNWEVDPFCLRCREIDLKTRTLNAYYRVAQTILSSPNVEQILVGTSRGEAFPADWLELKTGLKTRNLSVGGAEVLTKIAFIRMAEQFTHLKSVVWVMDYFEFVDRIRNERFLQCPAIKKYIEQELGKPLPFEIVQWLSLEIDHNTIEASFSFLKGPPAPFVPTEGGGARFRDCGPAKPQPVTEDFLMRLERTYSMYADNILLRPQLPEIWDAFDREVQSLREKGIQLTILVPPYHPFFRDRLKRLHPDIYTRHEEWLARLMKRQSKTVRVVSFFNGLPEDGPGVHNWGDGDHFTCSPALEMLEQSGVWGR